jgi:hypothetical protein
VKRSKALKIKTRQSLSSRVSLKASLPLDACPLVLQNMHLIHLYLLFIACINFDGNLLRIMHRLL